MTVTPLLHRHPLKRTGCPGGPTGSPHAPSLRVTLALCEGARVPPVDYRDNLRLDIP